MEVIHGLAGKELDLILHSSGGSPLAAESIVNYLRSKFNNIRMFVPHAAMSAATMICCAANKVVMGKQSSLGPIDPQFIIETGTGRRSVAAQTIIDQFEKAKEECKEPSNLGHWVPILRQYGPSLISECEDAIALSKELVEKWAHSYMFTDDNNAESKASKLADNLSKREEFKSHGRHINREQARSYGLKITDLECDQKLQDLVLSVYHSATHTHNGTPAVKIIENHLGKAFIKRVARQSSQPPQATKQQ